MTYDPSVRAELTRQHDDARTTIYRGVGLLASVPLTILVAGMVYAVLGGVTGTIVLLVGSVCALCCVVAGLITMGVGGTAYRRAGKQLHDYDHVRQLPQARIVERRDGLT